jgi:sugar/nucleoside kinase (ribokinase family)
MDPAGMTMYGQLCAWTLARAHARSGDRIALATYLGGDDAFPEAMAEYAEAYADQNERDYQVFMNAVQSGRLEAETGL